MTDYRVTFRISNARLWRVMEAKGFTTVKQLADASGQNYQSVCMLVGCRISGKKNDGTWREVTLGVSAALGIEPEELFTHRQATQGLKRATAIRDYSEKSIELLVDRPAQAALPDELLERKQLVEKAMARLTDRERAVIRARFFDNMTYDEASEETAHFTQTGEANTRERTRQVEAKALRKMMVALRKHFPERFPERAAEHKSFERACYDERQEAEAQRQKAEAEKARKREQFKVEIDGGELASKGVLRAYHDIEARKEEMRRARTQNYPWLRELSVENSDIARMMMARAMADLNARYWIGNG